MAIYNFFLLHQDLQLFNIFKREINQFRHKCNLLLTYLTPQLTIQHFGYFSRKILALNVIQTTSLVDILRTNVFFPGIIKKCLEV